MKAYLCGICETEFTTEAHIDRCLRCGSLDISSIEGANASPGANGEATDGSKDLPAVKEVLRRLCRDTYETTFQGEEWSRLIDAALIEVMSFLKVS